MGATDIGLYIAYGIFLLSFALAIILPAINAIKNPSGLMKSLMGLGALVILFIVSYVLSGSEVTRVAAALGVDENGSKVIGAGIIMFYLAFLIAIVGIIYSEINKALK